MIKQRDVATSIILTIFTCGIYGIIWYMSMTDEVGVVNKDRSLTGGTALIYSIFTCGIYNFFWAYKMGRDLYNAKVNLSMDAKDNSTLYLILYIFQLGIVAKCLIQSELNEIAQN